MERNVMVQIIMHATVNGVCVLLTMVAIMNCMHLQRQILYTVCVQPNQRLIITIIAYVGPRPY